MNWKPYIPVIVAAIALGTAWFEQRSKTQHYIDSGRYTDDYIEMLEQRLERKCD